MSALLPGNINTTDGVHSLNGIGDVGGVGMIVNQSGNYVDPMAWRRGIQGIGDVPKLTPGIHGLSGLEFFPGSGGSDPLLRNPIHPGMNGLGCVEQHDGSTNTVLDTGMSTGIAQQDNALSVGIAGAYDDLHQIDSDLKIIAGAVVLMAILKAVNVFKLVSR